MPCPNTRPTFFATTRWTLVRDAAREGDPSAVEAIGELARVYWQPLYRYARRKGKSKEDAEDLVQGFLICLMDPKRLGGADETKGRFRAFLLGSFHHWIINEWRYETREKRGGGSTTWSLDWESAETGLAIEISDDRTPDKLFDREWALALLGSVLDQLEAVCSREGNGDGFQVLKTSLAMDSARIPYVSIATELNMTEGAARVAVHRLRKRYRALLEAEVARTLASPEFAEDELRSLFAALAR